jgi:zinc transporter ZupT
MSEFFVLKQAGYSTKKALLVNFLVSSTVFVGIGIAYLALATHELEGVLLALGAGFFLHVVFHDLLPKRHEHESGTEFIKHVIVLVIGLSIMASVSYMIADSHVHGEDEHEEVHVDEDHHEGEEHEDKIGGHE